MTGIASLKVVMKVCRSGRPIETDDTTLLNLIESNKYQSARQVAAQLETNSSTVHSHLQNMGKVPKLGRSVPHDRQRRVDCAVSHLSISRRMDWLKTMLTSDEKMDRFQ